MDSTVNFQTEIQGAEGVRYHKLLSVLDRSLASVVDSFKLEELQAIFPDLAQQIPEKLADSYEQISSYLRNSANADFQAILMQYDMANKLADLDRLVSEAIERKAAASSEDKQPVSSMSPETINRGRSVAIKQAELKRLEAKLDQMKQENAEAFSSLSKQRAVLAEERKRLATTMDMVTKISN
ncbi:hypothetical protein GGI15_003087 [Coemansia interrupta]|uniref:Uncharacterized protein n=1 Tax=Coemansia interrupta TaxID=1126814 RepID=A0A9W8LHG8_9FUNG|nr:hypothetical protein GGI15_003087 [Coemansia interrupta]